VQESKKLADVVSESNPEFLPGNEAVHRSGQVSISCAAERKNKMKSQHTGSCSR
jgi:hypothetical protein